MIQFIYMSQVRTWKRTTLLSIAILLWAFFAPLTFAQVQEPESPEACGNFNYGSHQQPIEDCDNPFGRTDDLTNLMIGAETAVNGQTYLIEPSGLTDYGVPGENYFNRSFVDFYRHEGADYVAISTDFEYPEREVIEEKIAEYFNNLLPNSDQLEVAHFITKYTEIYDASYKYPFFYDSTLRARYFEAQLDQYVQHVYEELEEYVEDNVTSSRIALLPGTYTAVFVDTDEGPVMSYNNQSIWQRIWDNLIPKAYAYYYVRTVTFTLVDTMPEPEGASSVLFLPGIMGSRLYEESEECNPYSGNTSFKQIRWPSGGDCDIARLDMSSLGISENDIFTEQEDGVIEDIGAVVNLYESLLDDLADWKSDDLIADYRAVPYDWRLSLYDILKAREVDGRIVTATSSMYHEGYIYQSLMELVEESPAEKVVLVGHSNGGLVIQALLATMKENGDPLLEAIDKVILVAVPQTGTPESVVGVLHGVSLDPLSFLVSHEESRKLMNTSPFAYHLLPSEGYYDEVDTPVITFEPGTATDPWIAQFGGELDSLDEVTAFLAKESGRVTPEWNDTATPATMYSHLLGYGESVHSYLEDWRPDETQVYEVAGAGIATPATLTYFTDTECVRSVQTYFSYTCAEFESKLGYRVHEVIDGDGTVVVQSALASQGDEVEKRWLNFLDYNDENSNRKHSTFIEVDEVREFVLDVSVGDLLDSYTYLSTSEPDLSDENRLLLRLHSPLDMFVVLHDGEVVSSSTPSLRGVEYRRYGEVQQLSIPEDEKDYEIRLVGLAEGSFTLEIEQYEGEEMEERVTYSALPTSTTTKVTIDLEDEDLLSEVDLLIDYNGDGVFETTALPGLSQVTFAEPEVIATSTPVVVEKGGSISGTKVKDRSTLAVAPLGVLTASIIESEKSEYELLLQLIELLTQYRDLLIKLRVQ